MEAASLTEVQVEHIPAEDRDFPEDEFRVSYPKASVDGSAHYQRWTVTWSELAKFTEELQELLLGNVWRKY